MIVTTTEDRRLRSLLLSAARSDEDVVWGEDAVSSSIWRGFPRLQVADGPRRPVRVRDAEEKVATAQASVPLLVVTPAHIAEWESRWREDALPRAPGDISIERLRTAIRERATNDLWVDRMLARLAKAAGRPLPAAFRGFARRVMEDPARYSDMAPLATVSGMSRGALKGRFRRRGLASPHIHLRWIRLLAVARLLEDAGTTTMEVAHRLGLTHSGNLSRMVQETSGATPTELRTEEGRSRLVLALARELLAADALEAWDTLGEVFLRRAAA